VRKGGLPAGDGVCPQGRFPGRHLQC